MRLTTSMINRPLRNAVFGRRCNSVAYDNTTLNFNFTCGKDEGRPSFFMKKRI